MEIGCKNCGSVWEIFKTRFVGDLVLRRCPLCTAESCKE